MLSPSSRTLTTLSGLLVLPLSLATPELAHACGGTFCDNAGLPMPVDQSGEDILFVQDGGQIEVHVRIKYEGEAERFAWLVPLQAVPEISVGSELLFAQLGVGSAPNWQGPLSYECSDENPNGGGVFSPGDDSSGDDDPVVILEETVGVFEVVMLEGGTAETVLEWLGDNGYVQEAAAGPILQDYLDEGFLLAAVKLVAGAAVEEIHPLSFTMDATEPCVPLRLTSVAAQEDMGVRAYFLGTERWAPLNYKHVELNPLAHEWTQANSYFGALALHTELLSAAVDVAGGRAFTTDYAGTSETVTRAGIYADSWNELAFIGVDPIAAIDLIAQQQLNNHPLIQPLLMQFIPPPPNVDPTDFWNDIEDLADQIDLDAWDSEAFAAALSERIIEPGFHAVELLDIWPYLTRLSTTISPEEMTEDPVFIETPDLGEVTNLRTATGIDYCGWTGRSYDVPFDGDIVPVCLGEYEPGWPEILQNYPALRVEQVTPMGPMQEIEDFRAEILGDWETYQAECVADGAEGGEEGGNEWGAEGAEGDGGDAESSSEGGDEGPGAGAEDGATSCACSTSDPGPLGLLGVGFGLLGLASLRRGSRRRE